MLKMALPLRHWYAIHLLMPESQYMRCWLMVLLDNPCGLYRHLSYSVLDPEHRLRGYIYLFCSLYPSLTYDVQTRIPC